MRALREASRTPAHSFEDPHYFEGCLPIEVMAERGDDTLAFGPMRPVGLSTAGKRPYAVLQLRPENLQKSAYSLVGFQTKLVQSAQREVFRSIPGLANAMFLRHGAIHRNFYINAPKVLDDGLALHAAPLVRLAGQMTGVEGYVESAAVGLLVGRMLASAVVGATVDPPPRETAVGSLYAHVRGQTGAAKFEPMNIHFGLLPLLVREHRRSRTERHQAVVARAKEALQRWLTATTA